MACSPIQAQSFAHPRASNRALLMRLGIVLPCLMVACSSLQHATYPAWEPTSPVVPVVKSRSLARQYLEMSRRLWQDWGNHNYAYLRARQVSADEVQFTLLIVEQDRVVQRALLSARPDESGLGELHDEKYGSAPALLWWERGKEVGKHADGAPPLIVDQLYDVCREQVLDARLELEPRLYFRFDGFLQHCGFLVDDCPDCPVASIQSLGSFTPRLRKEPKDGVCNDRPGLVVAGDHWIGALPCGGCTCSEHLRGSEQPSSEEGELENLCKVDPAACDALESNKHPQMGSWYCRTQPVGDCRQDNWYPPEPACTGREHPLSAGAAWRKRCQFGRD